MEYLEGQATGTTFNTNPLQSGIENLEKGAFERGLPENESALAAGSGHPTQNFAPFNQRVSTADQTEKATPVILLIDDEEGFRNVLMQVLVNAGYDVIAASNGEEGIRYFHEKPADMIITDIIMPEKEGIETIIELKKAFPHVKLIAMSGGGWYGTDIDFDMARKLGAHTLNKPFALQELLDIVRETLDE